MTISSSCDLRFGANVDLNVANHSFTFFCQNDVIECIAGSFLGLPTFFFFFKTSACAGAAARPSSPSGFSP